MKTMQYINATLENGSIVMTVKIGDGAPEQLVLPMTEFFLLRLAINDQEADKNKPEALPGSPIPIQALLPENAIVVQDQLSNDPVLIFGMPGGQKAAFQIPRANLPLLLQQFLPYLPNVKKGQMS